MEKIELYRGGVYVDNMTSIGRLQKLASSIRPVKTEFPLIRIGSKNDGGYLVPDDLSDISVCFSPGVDVNSSFENDLLKKTGINSHLADFSVDAPPVDFVPKSFIKKFLGPLDNDKHITLQSWVEAQEEYKLQYDFILQMDIEGGEYLTLIATPEHVLRRFRIAVIEIHDVASWANTIFFNTVEAFFEKLLNNFYVVHNHPNNHGGLLDLNGFLAPQFFEITLIRKDRANVLGYSDEFPHPLDAPCYSPRAEMKLPNNWFGEH